MAGSSAALNYEFFSYFPVVAFGQAAVTFSSQNFGAGQYDRCRKIFRQTMLLSLMCAEVMGLGFVFGKELFVRFFTGRGRRCRIRLHPHVHAPAVLLPCAAV